MTLYLTVKEVLQMHTAFIKRFGGPSGVRDMGLLISAVETPKATMFGKDLHKTIYDKAAAYLFHIVQNHPFNDGNKRTAFGAAVAFMKLNEIPICFKGKDLEKLVIAAAQGQKTKQEIARFLEHGK